MSLSLKQLFTLSALLLLTPSAVLPAFADTKFENQSELGSEVKLPVHQWSDPDVPSKGIVVALQALIFDGKAWNQFARHLNAKGYTVYAQDFRGYGDWLTDTGVFGGDQAFHFGQSKDDLTKILTALRKNFPDKKIFCIGESLGANVAVWEASTDPKLLDGAIACGLSNKHYPLRPRAHWAVTLVKGLKETLSGCVD
jgi:alpha-beta hydrolase superfamily lysophospholipase